MSNKTEELEAQVYALEDQVAGLQQIISDMAALPQTGPATAREYQQVLAKLVVIWDKHENGTGAPDHGHNVAGKWDTDGSVCEECAVHEEARALLRRSVAAPLAPDRPLRSRVESCNRGGGCVCGGDTPGVRQSCGHFQWLQDRM